jgi:hypothetical protein
VEVQVTTKGRGGGKSAHEVGRIIAPALGSIPCNYLGLGEPFSFPVTVIGYPAVLPMLRTIRPSAASSADRDARNARYTQQQQPGGSSSFGADGTVLSKSLRNRDEANVPTQQPEAEEDARVQDQDANPGRPPHPGPAPRQGPGEHLGLNAGIRRGSNRHPWPPPPPTWRPPRSSGETPALGTWSRAASGSPGDS